MNQHKRLRHVTMPEGSATSARYGYAVTDAPRHRPIADDPALIVARTYESSTAPWAVFTASGARIPGLTFDTLRNGAAFGRDVLGYVSGRVVARRGVVPTRAARIVARYASRHGGQGPATVAPSAGDLPRADAPAPIPHPDPYLRRWAGTA